MESNQKQQLTPDLVVMAIQGGMMDDALTFIEDAVRSRREVKAVNVAGSLLPGDRFLVTNCSPKKWNGVEVEFTGKREGIWLVTRIVHDLDVMRLHNCSEQYITFFREQKFRTSHVGVLTRHQATGIL